MIAAGVISWPLLLTPLRILVVYHLLRACGLVGFFTGPQTVTCSSLRVLCWVVVF